MEDFADTRAGGERGEEDFRFFGGSGDGGAEIKREQRRERGGLRGVGSGSELGGELMAEEGPAGGLARCEEGDGAQGGPELDEGAEDGGFGELAAETLADVDGGLIAIAVEGFPGAQDDRGNVAGGRGLPLAIAADGGDEGKDVGSDEAVRLLRKAGEEIEGDGAALGDEAGSEGCGTLDGRRGRRGSGSAQTGLDKGGRGRGQLGCAGKKEAEAEVVEPGGGAVEGAQSRIGGLVPQRDARDL